MILHQGTLLSEDLLEKQFVCDLNKCKGACCVEGDLGAPLEEEELEEVEAAYAAAEPYMSEAGKKEIKKQGYYILDEEGDWSTPTINGRECAYAFYNEEGILGCAIEKAYQEGKTTWRKPISCHLYPIRTANVGDYEALNYDQWSICSPACQLGQSLQVPVYQFARDALMRRYGKEWYQELDDLAQAMAKD